jgi:hypothetical protein
MRGRKQVNVVRKRQGTAAFQEAVVGVQKALFSARIALTGLGKVIFCEDTWPPGKHQPATGLSQCNYNDN